MLIIIRVPAEPVLQKRASSFTEEERESARQFRKNALKQGKSLLSNVKLQHLI